MGEHRIGILAGQRDAIIGRASLEDHRLALRRTLDVERPFHLENAALVVEPTERVRREERASVALAHEGTVIPRIPQPLHHLQLRPEPSSGEVTTFQPARPPLSRSSEANWRATVNGSL
ncbi:hypothetical protein G6F50_017579 [Rhizopus delemar]|uniref:Uncharacterized protein n=1 Tax=Rhizopus delemar TaxID=936053 RepID=A0A9P6XQ83_9FUNG|nr:hypothetical protein G6F50_017579 [Rhizopus delemar]